MKSSLWLLIFCLAAKNPNFAQQTLKSEFIAKDTICLNEKIQIVNTSTNASDYLWDLCLDDLNQVPLVDTALILDESEIPMGMDIVYDSAQWFGFATSRSNNKIFRLEFGGSLMNDPEIIDLGNIDGLLNGPRDIKFFKENQVWYALLLNRVTHNIIRLKFEVGLEEPPTAVNLGNLSSWNLPRGLDIVTDEDKVFAIVSSFADDKLTLINFGNSITNFPSGTDIQDIGIGELLLDGPRGVSLRKESDSWFGMVASYNNNKLIKLDFGSSLINVPTFSEVETLVQPTGIILLKEGSTYHGFCMGQNSGLLHLNFGNSLDNVPKTTNLGNFNLLKNIYAFTIVRESPGWIGMAIRDDKKEFFRINFDGKSEECYSLAEDISLQAEDLDSIFIDLTVFDEFGNKDDTLQIITVRNEEAPAIDISIDNICTSSISVLQGSSNQNIETWNWTINSAMRVGENVTYQFLSSDEYPITLEVQTSDGCGQRITQPITIYDPPDPNFLVETSGAICSNGTVNFTNQTNTQGADSLITYNWNFSGEDSTTVSDPEFIFTSGGEKIVTLTAAIPGCEASKDTTFAVFDGPSVDFVFENRCEGEVVEFLNQTTGSEITEYDWDFGDGNTFSAANLVSPEHVFEGPGAYDVSLTVNNAQGCENKVVQTFKSFAKPEAAFSAELSCAGTPTIFSDETEVEVNTNVVLWTWDFGDNSSGTSVRNPEYTFSSPGAYDVQLVAETNEGCVDSVMQQIVVETPVQPGFEAITICAPDTFEMQLNDTSLVTGEDAITQWLWQVESEIYQTQNPVHTFDSPGEYSVSLTATASSLCNAAVTRTVTVLPFPEADFSFTQACVQDAVAFADLSAYPEYIANYQWDFGGVSTSQDVSPSFTFQQAGSYSVKLTIEDIHGCLDSLTQSINILPQPVADFTVDKTTAAAPFVVDFTNTSADASQFQWDFAGLDTSTDINPSYTFDEIGTYPVQLAVANEIGCADTLLRTFTVIKPVFDVSLDNISLQSVSNGGTGTNIILTVSNSGTLPVQGFHVAIEVDKQLALERNFTNTVEPGATVNFPLGVAISNINSATQNTRYVCATLTPLEDNFAESEKDDNIFCVNLDNSFYSLPPFPNPVQGLLEIELILPSAEVVDLSVATSTGHVLQNYTFSDLQAGLNILQLDTSTLPTGMYVLTIRYQGKLNTYRLVVNP